MDGKQMEGDDRERREHGGEAREASRKPSETGATLGASQQRAEAKPGMSHQERLDPKHEGKVPSATEPEAASPGSRDDDGPDHERHPRR